MSFPFYKQYDQRDCGPTCLRMIAKYYGKQMSLQSLREKSDMGKTGINLLGLSRAAEKLGFRTIGSRLSYKTLKEDVPFPCIAHWKQDHFIVIYKIKKDKLYVADPFIGLLTYKKEEFLRDWISTKTSGIEEGVVLLLEPTAQFYEIEEEKSSGINFGVLLKYLFRYKKLLFQLILSLAVSSFIQLMFPFLTKSIVDLGIGTGDINIIYIIIIGQVFLYLSRLGIELLRGWLLLHISSRVNLSILSDFFLKLMRLPLNYFDQKMTGDILQRISDHERIQTFLTVSSLNSIFSTINLCVFGTILFIYNKTIFLTFAVGTILYFIWIFFFLKRRRELDFKKFEISTKNKNKVVQLILGMQEIKLHNSEVQKRWEWERIQALLFKWNIKTLALGQYQQTGAFFFNEGKNILITLLAAVAVVHHEITLGTMLAIQYIIGQLTSPVEQLVQFIQNAQDAKISMERFAEIHDMDDEEPITKPTIGELPLDKTITIDNLSFTYPGAGNQQVLNNVSFEIPQNKVTAIVGMSGSGKTTLLKLMLKFHKPDAGSINVGGINLDNIKNSVWRDNCSMVMQEGFIFSDTIAKNIALGEDIPDIKRLINAVKTANIDEFIQRLPLGFNTKIGSEGHGISQGQKQRILIARAIYKEPEFIFFDEATNSLDANNEKVIMDNMNVFFKGRTVVVVAHRLSTVKNADQIIVLDKGNIVEFGTHDHLVKIQGDYHKLVRNQLELGN
jgi:ATP-binding cassette subfamily B protein